MWVGDLFPAGFWTRVVGALALALALALGEGATDCGPAPRPVYKQHSSPPRARRSRSTPLCFGFVPQPSLSFIAFPSCFTLLSCSLPITQSFQLLPISLTHSTRVRATHSSRRNGSRCFRRSCEEGFQAQGQPCQLPGRFTIGFVGLC